MRVQGFGFNPTQYGMSVYGPYSDERVEAVCRRAAHDYDALHFRWGDDATIPPSAKMLYWHYASHSQLAVVCAFEHPRFRDVKRLDLFETLGVGK